jgi:hypothetical protein
MTIYCGNHYVLAFLNRMPLFVTTRLDIKVVFVGMWRGGLVHDVTKRCPNGRCADNKYELHSGSKFSFICCQIECIPMNIC